MSNVSGGGEDQGAVDGTKVWPPPGFKSWYRVTESLEGQPEVQYDLTVVSTFEQVHLSTCRIGRHGGVNDDDRRFRGELYTRIGAITVAAGQAETAMKRLLLLLRQERNPAFSLVDETWTELEKKLRRESAKGGDWRREGLRSLLGWASEKEIKRRRDDAIHSCWWDYSGIGVRRSRFKRKADGQTILSSFDDLDEDWRLIREYAGRLDGLLGVEWPIAMLPDPTGTYPVATPPSEKAL